MGRAVCRTGPFQDPVRPSSYRAPLEDLAFRPLVSPSLVPLFTCHLVVRGPGCLTLRPNFRGYGPLFVSVVLDDSPGHW